MNPPAADQSKIQVITQLLLSGALAQEQFENYLNQEFGDVFIFLWQIYLAQEFSGREGHFITEDPARDGNNWYLYVRNNPLVRIDPSGLEENFVDGVVDIRNVNSNDMWFVGGAMTVGVLSIVAIDSERITGISSDFPEPILPALDGVFESRGGNYNPGLPRKPEASPGTKGPSGTGVRPRLPKSDNRPSGRVEQIPSNHFDDGSGDGGDPEPPDNWNKLAVGVTLWSSIVTSIGDTIANFTGEFSQVGSEDDLKFDAGKSEVDFSREEMQRQVLESSIIFQLHPESFNSTEIGSTTVNIGEINE